MDIYERAIATHRKLKGKIALQVKSQIRTREDLSWAYTPGVAAVSTAIAKDRTQVWELTARGNWVAVVSDGSAVLGLGNIGPGGALPVMEGKAVLFKEFADVDAFPICLDTQDVNEIVETVVHIAPSFGGINLEDIAAPRCFEIEERLRRVLDIPVFHDDQHGTAIVVLAGLTNALAVTGRTFRSAKVVISGVGAAGSAIANILHAQGVQDIILVDSQGILVRGRRDLNPMKERLLTFTNFRNISGTLADAMIGRDVFIGVSKAGIVSEAMIASMNPDPIIFAMANPTPEIMPELAKRAGAKVVATGRSDFPNQVNNVLVFPGIFRGALDVRAKTITEEMELAAAKALAAYVLKPTPDAILPDPLDRGVAKAVARAVRAEAAH